MNNKNNYEVLPTLTFEEHFSEFKKRFIFTLIYFIACCFLTYSFKEELLNFFTYPLYDTGLLEKSFVFTNVTEPFFVYIKLTLWSAMFLTIPFIMFQIYGFIRPALYKKERNFVFLLINLGTILFFAGMSFVYFILMPNIFEFFLNFAKTGFNMEFMAKISQYFSFCLQLILAFGLAFELPIVLLILSKIGIISAKSLENKRKYAIVIIAFAAAVLTPPDVFTQIALIIPLVGLYEITIMLLKFSKKSNI